MKYISMLDTTRMLKKVIESILINDGTINYGDNIQLYLDDKLRIELKDILKKEFLVDIKIPKEEYTALWEFMFVVMLKVSVKEIEMDMDL